MTDSLEQKAQKAFDKGKNDAAVGRLSDVELFDDAVVQKYFSGFATGEAERKKVPENDKKMYVLQFARGMSDANAGHRPSVFGGAYLDGYMLIKPNQPRTDYDPALDYINEIRWEYDLPLISREDLIGDE